jgi:hypothetical protein
LGTYDPEKVMAGLRSDEDILKAFEGLKTAPGSKRERKSTTPEADRKRAKAFGETNGWDSTPVIKLLKGKEQELFTVGALAHALEKKVVTIRLWEKKGYIPMAPYRLRSKQLNGNKVSGNRVYTRELIEIAVEEFDRRKLLGSARVEWNQLSDLTDTLVRRWQEAIKRES